MTNKHEEIEEAAAGHTSDPKRVAVSPNAEHKSPENVPAKPSPPKPLGSPLTGKLSALPLPKPSTPLPAPLQKPGSSPSGAFPRPPSGNTGAFPKVSSSPSVAIVQPPKPKPLPNRPTSTASGAFAKVSSVDSTTRATSLSPSGAFARADEQKSKLASGAYAKVPSDIKPLAAPEAAKLPSPEPQRLAARPSASASGAFVKAPQETKPVSSSFAKVSQNVTDEAPLDKAAQEPSPPEISVEVPSDGAALKAAPLSPSSAFAKTSLAPEAAAQEPVLKVDEAKTSGAKIDDAKTDTPEKSTAQPKDTPRPAPNNFKTVTPSTKDQEKEKDDGFVQLDIASLLLDGNEPSEAEFTAPKRPSSAPLSTSAVLAGVPQVIPEGLILDSRYRLLKLLGEGGMGAVYKAEHLLMRKPVAIKILKKEAAVDRDLVMRFIREAQLASRLSNPHCVTIHDFGQTSDRDLYLVMELIEGDVLRDLMLEEGMLSIERAYWIIVQLLDALGAAHDIGVIHRDVKPENIMLVKEPGRDGGTIAKLLDFGIARPSSPVATGVTRSGFTVGTPGYIAPEQALGKTLDGRTDLYAAAVIFYEMICGRRPYLGNSPMEIITNQVSQPPPRPSQAAPDAKIPIAIEDVLLRALSKDPDKRYPNAKEFRLALEKALEKSGRSSAPPGGGELAALPVAVSSEDKVSDDELLRVAGHRRVNAVVAGVLFGVLLGGGAVAGYFAYSNSNNKPKPPEISVPPPIVDTTPHFNPKEARELYEKGDLIGAASSLAALPKRDRNTPETQILLAMVSSQLNDWNNTRAAVRMVRHFGPFPSELVPVLLRNAMLAQSSKDASLARAAVAELGGEALKEIASMLRSPDDPTQKMAYTFLLEIDESEAPLVENVREILEQYHSCAERQSLLRNLLAINSPSASDDLAILDKETKLFCVKGAFEQK